MSRSFTPSFQHFQQDVERSLESKGKCEKNDRGQLVYRGYQDAPSTGTRLAAAQGTLGGGGGEA